MRIGHRWRILCAAFIVILAISCDAKVKEAEQTSLTANDTDGAVDTAATTTEPTVTLQDSDLWASEVVIGSTDMQGELLNIKIEIPQDIPSPLVAFMIYDGTGADAKLRARPKITSHFRTTIHEL